MKREGKLKTQTDVDKFWKEITQPEVFYAQFKVNRSAGMAHRSHIQKILVIAVYHSSLKR